MQTIQLKTPTTWANIYIGDDCLDARLPLLTEGQTNFVLTDETVYALHADFFKRYFKNAELFVLPAGEEYKSFSSLERILKAMTRAGLLRTSRLFAVGGGVIGDIGGLCASLYMRGISCVQIPTTLLAQIDSSVGGKTAVDFDGVKNIIGAFYQPFEVLIAPKFLKTLPAREWKCGVGELVKYGALNAEIFRFLQTETDWLKQESLQKLIALCVSHKASVVQADEKETGERKSLNVGHTTGHAIELAYRLSHGESVLYGACYETQIAIKKGVCQPAYGRELIKIIRRALLLSPHTNPDFSNISDCVKHAKADKKNVKQGEIVLAVAKNEGEWTTLALPVDEYQKSLESVVIESGYDRN